MKQKNTLTTMPQLLGPCIQAGWFTPEETADIVAVSYKYDIGVFIRLAIDTGLSIDEIKGLRWDSLVYELGSDYEYYDLFIKEVRYDYPLTLCDNPNSLRLKTGCIRRLCIPVKTGRELLQWCKLHTIRNTPYMLVDENGDLMEGDRFSEKYMQVIDEANAMPLGFEALRNTFVFNALDAGLSSDVIGLILGLQPSYQLSVAEAAQIKQQLACGFPSSQIEVFPTVDETPINPKMMNNFWNNGGIFWPRS